MGHPAAVAGHRPRCGKAWLEARLLPESAAKLPAVMVTVMTAVMPLRVCRTHGTGEEKHGNSSKKNTTHLHFETSSNPMNFKHIQFNWGYQCGTESNLGTTRLDNFQHFRFLVSQPSCTGIQIFPGSSVS